MAILATKTQTEDENALYFRSGSLSLKQFLFLKQKSDPDYVLEAENVVRLFYFLLEFVFFLQSQNCYHSDIKPDNILFCQEFASQQQQAQPQTQTQQLLQNQASQLYQSQSLQKYSSQNYQKLFSLNQQEPSPFSDDPNQQSFYQFKIIDFGTFCNKYSELKGCSEDYYFSLARNTNINDQSYHFQNSEDRLKGEIFTILRTVQECMLTQKQFKSHFTLFLDLTQSQDKLREQATQKYKQIIESIRNNYFTHSISNFNQSDPHTLAELTKIFEFMESKGLAENYQSSELREMLQEYRDSAKQQAQSYQSLPNYIELNNEQDLALITNYVREKRATLLTREGVLNQLFGIQNYVELKMSKSPDYSSPTRLMDRCLKFIFDKSTNNNSSHPAFVLEGKSGGGKSLFLLELLRKLNLFYKNKKIDFMRVYYIKLREYSEGYLAAKQYQQQTLSEYVYDLLDQIKDKKTEKTLFVLDGYDEYNDKNLQITQNLIPLSKYPNTKIVMTCRENYATQHDYQTCFGANQFELNYICPFDDDPRNEYIQKFVKTVQGLKKYQLDFESFATVDEYEKYFKDYGVLEDLTHVPFTLRIIMNILPYLVKSLEADKQYKQQTVNNIYISRTNIFDVFTRFYYSNELKRLIHDVNYREMLDQLFLIEDERDYYDDKRNQQLFNVVDRVNELISWNILANNNLMFNLDIAEKIVKENATLIKQYISDFDQINHRQFVSLVTKFSPLEGRAGEFTYIHKSIYEYYVQSSVMKEIKRSCGGPL